MADDPRKLRDEAHKAQAAGKYKKALELYLKLAQLDPTDAQWPQRAGDCLRKLDKNAEAIRQFEVAARVYAQRGFLVKAIAVAKIILQIDPSNTAAQEQVLALNTARGIPAPRARDEAPDRRSETPEVAPPRPAPPPPRLRTPPAMLAASDEPLSALELRELVTTPEVTGPMLDLPTPRSSLPPGVVEIPIVEPLSWPLDHSGLRRTPLFSDLSEPDLVELVTNCQIEERQPGEVILCEGEPGDAMYVIAEGAVRVVRGHPPVDLARLGEGAFFGEIALATDAPRQASVIADEPTSLLVVPRLAVNEVVRKSEHALGILISFLRDRLVSGVLATAPLFRPFSPDERVIIAKRFRFLEARSNEPIVVEGERSRGLYVILVGGAVAVRRGATGEDVLGELRSGDVFGEMSLLNHEEAVATVRTTSKVWLLELPGRAFLELVMTHPQFLDYIGELADLRKRQNESKSGGGPQHATFV